MAREKLIWTVQLRHSIRTKWILIMIMMMGMVMFSLAVMNYTLLSPFYENRKADLLAITYQSISHIIESDEEYSDGSGKVSEDSLLRFEITEQNTGADLYVFQVNDVSNTFYYNFAYPQVNAIEEKIIKGLTKAYIAGEFSEISGDLSKGDSDKSLVKCKDTYKIYKAYDNRIGSNYLELLGKSDSGLYVYLRMNYQSMNESIGIFNRFLLYIGTGIMVIGVMFMVFFGNSFAKPIMQIAEIAKRMSELDFDAKYTVSTEDEIGVLGSSINALSENLQYTISELKTANNELKKDIEKKTQIDEMRKEFLSNVSHELKTPIALIQGYAEGLQDNINDDLESRQFYCEVIIDEARKMNEMVKKLLSLNQIEFGDDQVQIERIDIVSLIKNVMQSVMLLTEQKGAKLSFDKEYGAVYVWADEYMLQQVVTNYISNAIHYVEGENKIEISLEKKEEKLQVKVFNTGKQIPEEDLEKIWIKFYKVDKARTREYGGNGIGLSIVKAVMEAMNGRYGVTNKENGVEFWFEVDADFGL